MAPSGYRAHMAKLRDPTKRSVRRKRDEDLLPQISQVWNDNLRVYGPRKVWRQLRRQQVCVARCTVERLMRRLGLRGVVRGKPVRTTIADPKAPCPLDKVNRQFKAIESSVGSTGDSYDNALAETINGLYKAEVIHRRTSWKSREEVELATLTWVAWFNNVRLLEPIGHIPPAEAEANYYRQQAALPAVT